MKRTLVIILFILTAVMVSATHEQVVEHSHNVEVAPNHYEVIEHVHLPDGSVVYGAIQHDDHDNHHDQRYTRPYQNYQYPQYQNPHQHYQYNPYSRQTYPNYRNYAQNYARPTYQQPIYTSYFTRSRVYLPQQVAYSSYGNPYLRYHTFYY